MTAFLLGSGKGKEAYRGGEGTSKEASCRSQLALFLWRKSIRNAQVQLCIMERGRVPGCGALQSPAGLSKACVEAVKVEVARHEGALPRGILPSRRFVRHRCKAGIRKIMKLKNLVSIESQCASMDGLWEHTGETEIGRNHHHKETGRTGGPVYIHNDTSRSQPRPDS